MKKQDIIQSITTTIVPAGAQLAQHEVPNGLTFASIGQGDAGGLKIIAAQMFADQLTEDTASLGEEPTSALFEQLHGSVIDFNRFMIAGTMLEAVAEEMISDHRKMIERLRQIAQKLGISYHEPDDPILGSSAGGEQKGGE